MKSTHSLTVGAFIEQLHSHQSSDEKQKIQRSSKSGKGEYAEGDLFIGVRMGQVFAIAKGEVSWT